MTYLFCYTGLTKDGLSVACDSVLKMDAELSADNIEQGRGRLADLLSVQFPGRGPFRVVYQSVVSLTEPKLVQTFPSLTS